MNEELFSLVNPTEEVEKKQYDAGNPDDVKKQRKSAKRDEIMRLAALKAIMSTTEGRAYVWWLLGECGVFHISFAKDPYVTAFNEGRRNVGNRVFAELQLHCLGDYQKMVSEAQLKDQANVPT